MHSPKDGITFIIPAKPQSVNSLTYANPRHGWKPAAKKWSHEIFHFLNQTEHLNKFTAIRDYFDRTKHRFCVKIIHYMPHDKLFSKQGTLKDPDISNIEKPLIDLLFDKKFYDREPPYGVKNINHDDKNISDLISKKRVSKTGEYYIKVKIKVKSLDPIKSIEPLSPQDPS